MPVPRVRTIMIHYFVTMSEKALGGAGIKNFSNEAQVFAWMKDRLDSGQVLLIDRITDDK